MDNPYILIVEDDVSFSIKLEMMLETFGYPRVRKTDSGEEALEMIEKARPDLILMDVGLKGKLSGIETAQKIRPLQIPIIYLTAYTKPQTFERAKGTLPYAYLNKPLDETALKRAVELVLALAHSSAKPLAAAPQKEAGAVFVKKRGILEKVNFHDIIWVEASGNYCTLFTEEKKYAMKISLKKLTSKLPAGEFIRSHRSVLIQKDKIQKINLPQNQIHLPGATLPIGRRYRKEVNELAKEM